MRGVWCLVSLVLLMRVAHGQDERLPGESRPSYQVVNIAVYREDEGERSYSFEGQTSLTAEVVRDTEQIVLHAAVNVSDVRVQYQHGAYINCSYEQPQDGRDFLIVSLQEQVAAGSLVVLDISFNAKLGYREPGFSRYDYDWDGKQGSVYATQFMPNHARRALPCYDEPALKAYYQLNMRTKPKFYYNSNTRDSVDVRPDEEGFRHHFFSETPKISAYQLSWALHDMGGLQSDRESAVWSVDNLFWQNVFAAHVGPLGVDAMEDMLGVTNVGISKMDYIAIPGYIEDGESHLGIILGSENALLVDDDQTSEANKERVLGLIEHEVAHLWFGGLVSPSWWNDLWLSEGFASYFQWIAAAQVRPSWQLREVFAVNILLQEAMPADVGSNSYPLSKSSNVSVEQAFDESLSEKGAAVVWMIENIMGSKAFYSALNKYLTQNRYLDVRLELLLAALDGEAPASSLPEGASLSSVVLPWLEQSGFPLISVSRNYADGSAIISQAPYLSLADAVWPVPITYMSRSEASYSASAPRLWLLDSELAVPDLAQADDWLLFNFNVSGYYRVNYDEQNWELLSQQLLRDPMVVPAVARAQLLVDAASLAAEAQLLPASVALRLASYLSLEYSYIPWRAVPGVLRNLEILVDDDAADDFREFVLSLIQHMAILLRYRQQPGEEHVTRILRADIVSIACNYGEQGCLSSMYEQFQNFMAAPGNSSNQVGPDLKRIVYCYGVQQGGEEAYNFLMDLYSSTIVVSERIEIVQAVACSQLLDGSRLLELTAAGAEGGFRREDLRWLLEGLLQRHHSKPAALQFVSHGAHLLSRPGEKDVARKLLRQAALELHDLQLLDKLEGAAVALEDESLVAVAQWRRDVIARGVEARRDAARWLQQKSWRL